MNPTHSHSRILGRILAACLLMTLTAVTARAQSSLPRGLAVVTDEATLARSTTIAPGSVQFVHVVVTEEDIVVGDGWSGAQFKVDVDPRLQVLGKVPSSAAFFSQEVAPDEWVLSFTSCLQPNQLPFTLLTYVVQTPATVERDLRIGLSDPVAFGEPMLLAHCIDPAFLEPAVNLGGAVINPSAPTIVHLSASETTLVEGRDLELVWATVETTNASLDGVAVAGSGTTVLQPAVTATYVLDATSGASSVSESLTVEVVQKPIVDLFTAEPAVGATGSAKLSWSVRGADDVQLNGTGRVWPIAGALVPITSGPVWSLSATNEWGTTTVFATLGNPGELPPIIGSFTALPNPYFPGDPVNLSYGVFNADTVSIDQGVGAVDPTSGNVSVTPTGVVTYTLSATNSFGTSTQSVTVAPGPPVLNSFSITPSDVPIGTTVTMQWSVDGADEVRIDPDFGVVAPDSGRVSFTVFTGKAYTLTATNSVGSINSIRGVRVVGSPIESFRAIPSSIFPGESVELHWESFPGFDLSIQPDVGPVVGPTGSVFVTPPADSTEYVLSAASAGTTVTATTGPIRWTKPSIQLSRSVGQPLYLVPFDVTAVIAGADSATFEPGVGAIDPAGGTFNVSITQITTFTVTATNAMGTSTATMTVAPNNSLPTVTLVTSNSSPNPGELFQLNVTTTFAQSLTLEPGFGSIDPAGGTFTTSISQPTTFVATARNPRGSTSDSLFVFVPTPEPDVSITTSNPLPMPGQAFTLTVAAAKADSLILEPGFGSIDPAGGSFVTSITAPTTFTVTGFNTFGVRSDSVAIGVETRVPQLALALLSDPHPFAGQNVAVRTIVSLADSAWVEPASLGWTVTNGILDHAVVFEDTTSVVLHATNANGSSQVSLVVEPILPIAQLTGDVSVESGSVAHLQVVVQGAQTTTLEPHFGTIAGSGNYAVTITTPTDFVLTATNPLGTVTRTHRVEISRPGILRFVPDKSEALVDEPVELSWIVAGADSLQITDGQGLDYRSVAAAGSLTVTAPDNRTYTLTAFGNTANATASFTVTRVPLQIRKLTVTPSAIAQGQSATLEWEVVGDAQVSLDPFGTVAAVGSRTVSPDSSATYVLTATNGTFTRTQSTVLHVSVAGSGQVVMSWSSSEVPGRAPSVALYQPFDFYVLAQDATEGILAYEFGLDIQLPPDIVIINTEIPYPNAVNVGSYPSFIVGPGNCLQPAPLIPLLKVTALSFSYQPSGVVSLRGAVPSSFGDGAPGYYSCTRILRPFDVGSALYMQELGSPLPVLEVEASASFDGAGVEIQWSGPAGLDPTAVRILRRHGEATFAQVALLDGDSRGMWIDSEPRSSDLRDTVYRVVLESPEQTAASAEIRVEGDTPPPSIAARSRLLPNIPNPFNPSTELRFELSRLGDARVDIFDAAGRHVWRWTRRGLAAGQHSTTWVGRDDAGRAVSSGVYLVQLTTGDGIDTQRIVLVK